MRRVRRVHLATPLSALDGGGFGRGGRSWQVLVKYRRCGHTSSRAGRRATLTVGLHGRHRVAIYEGCLLRLPSETVPIVGRSDLPRGRFKKDVR